jgi:hypothetical protein
LVGNVAAERNAPGNAVDGDAGAGDAEVDKPTGSRK